jgi:uncharacterized protein YidB (DUF937 family)
MSGFFSQILGTIGGQQEGQPKAIAGILQQVLAQNGGGVASLIQRFEGAGLGEHAQSWVSPDNNNMPISADHIGRVFSPEEIEGWAAQAGTTPDRMRSVLAEALPHAVNHVTPDGQTPEVSVIPSLLSAFLGDRR